MKTAPYRGSAREEDVASKDDLSSISTADQRKTQSAGPRKGSTTLPCFDAARPLEPYQAQVELAVLHNGWERREAATHLALAVEGKALRIFAREQQQDVEQMMIRC